MRATLNKLTEHLRVCSNCGRGTFLRTSSIDLYCSDCWRNLFEQALVSSSDYYPFDNSSLFVWNPFTPQIENLIYSLKAGGIDSAFRKLAERFALGLSARTNNSKAVLVVPPSLRFQNKDHAWAWGRALSEVLGLEIVSPFEFATEEKANGKLRFESLRPQKQLKVNERFERQFKLKEGIDPKASAIVFVDDLITSGATASAAYKALNSPIDFKVWTIARRPKLAGI